MQLTVRELKAFLEDKPDEAFVVLTPLDDDDYARTVTGNPQHIYNVQFYEGMVWLI